MNDDEKEQRELIKMAKFGAAYGIGSETFAKAVAESPANFGSLSPEQTAAFTRAVMRNMADQMEAARFKIFNDVARRRAFAQTNYKEETIVQHRFGERKPHNGKRLYRLWIDGVWVGDFKSKAERRKVLESTRVLMEEPDDKAWIREFPQTTKLGLFDDLPPDSYF